MNKTINNKRLTVNEYEPIIGLEVHVELNTKSKMFCRCSADYFGKEPNTHTCPVCLGLPGALPYINQAALDSCIKIGLALNCSISPLSRFERKNYFYPDLPKGFQVSQYRWPLCVGGILQVTGYSGQGTTIRINRVHQEEDTAKLAHQYGTQNSTAIDFNRSSVPLVEIVTEPDFRDIESVKDYAKKLQQLFRYLGVSNADMEKGDMRLEANVSVRRASKSKSQTTEDKLPNYRVELKNINSFTFMAAAIEYEIQRQITALEKGEQLSQETRGWNVNKKCTYIQRSKEQAHDYRYFPEPDLPELRITESRIKSLESSLPELPWDKADRLIKEYGIKKTDAQILTDTKELAQYFEDTIKHGKEHKISSQEIANYIVNKKPSIGSVLPTQIIELLKGKKVGIIEDAVELEELAKQAIKETPKAVEDFKKGKLAAIQVLIGGVMRISAGKANTAKAKEALEKLLKE